MVRFTLALLCAANVVLAQNEWIAPNTTDSRSPCPMLNTLANHAYLPRDGKNIDVTTLITGLDAALNLDEGAKSFFKAQGEKALTTSSTGSATTFHLADLAMHNVIEHDGSLSRADKAQGDNLVLNKDLFAETKSYWPDSTITTSQAAAALEGRIDTQKKANPSFDLPLSQLTNAIGQTAMYLGVFGTYGAGDANKDHVVYFFEQERLPVELGWTRRADDDKITATGIYLMIANVAVHFVGAQLGLGA